MDDIVNPGKHLDLIKKCDQIFLEKVPFNQYLGMRIDEYGEQHLKLWIDLRQQLVGNFTRHMLHGGVILSVLDAVGGMQVFRELIQRFKDQPGDEILELLNKVSTINLNTQFLRPGIGKSFYATAHVERLGNKVAFVQMQMYNQDQLTIATATGVYSAG